MPIYEYQCETCSHEFEELVRCGERARCPHCRSESVRRKLSTFAKKSGAETTSSQATSSVSTGKCSGCAGGSCAGCH